MKNYTTLFSAITASCLLMGCNNVTFTPATVDVPAAKEFPTDPTFTFKTSDGLCKSDSSTELLSCLQCDVPHIIPKPQLSAKAQALMDSMFLACQVPNKSDHNNFRPTRDMILNKLNRASELNYPDSPRTPMMELVVQGLTNPNDDHLRRKMFGGLWYSAGYSDAFETYFGISVEEAKSTFCWNGDQMNGAVTDPTGVYSLHWIQCQYNERQVPCQELPEYVVAQTYRAQLKTSLHLGVTDPYSAPIPDPEKVCRWNKFEGDDLVAAQKQGSLWIAQGHKVFVHIKAADGAESCGQISDSGFKLGSYVEMATYICQ